MTMGSRLDRTLPWVSTSPDLLKHGRDRVSVAIYGVRVSPASRRRRFRQPSRLSFNTTHVILVALLLVRGAGRVLPSNV